MQQFERFKYYKTDNNLDLYICNNNKFKTNLIQFFIITPLTVENVNKTALIPNILYQGSKKHPSSRDIKIELDKLYGTNLSCGIIKRGEMQFVKFSMEIVNEKYLDSDSNLFLNALKLLQDIIVNPVFSEKYFQQERKNIINNIKSLKNNKYQYALQKCFENMCSKESYRLYKLGDINEHQRLHRKKVYEHYSKLLKKSHIKIFVTGDKSSGDVYNAVNNLFSFKHQQLPKYNNTVIKSANDNVNEVREQFNIKQGILVMGYRSNITRNNKLYYPLLVYNAILGAFTHSKLFRNIREKEGLAYYIQSSLESTKGIMNIIAGIDVKNFQKTRDLIYKEVDSVAAGNFDSNEFKWAVKSLLNNFRSTLDSMRGITGHYLLGLINNHPENIEQSIEKIKSVKHDEVLEAAANVKLDTIYLLDKKEK